MVPAPPVRRRLVGKALRQHREKLGYTLKDAAQIVECHYSKLSRIETGERGIRPRELRELMEEYHVPDEQQAVLTVLADPRGAFGWDREYADVLPGAWRDYLILEAAASRIAAYEAQQIPGLLQTPAYARALAKIDPKLDDDEARKRAVAAVLARQQVILEERRPEIRLILGQAALHQQVGSSKVMNEQLAHVAKTAEAGGRVSVQVLTFGSGAHAATGDGSLAILQIAQTPGLGIVHLGGIGGGVCLEDQGALASYAEVFDQLRAFAETPAQSAVLLRGLCGF